MGKQSKKWASVGLPLIEDDTEKQWFKRVLELKDERKDQNIAQLVEQYPDLEDELALIDSRRSELTALKEALDRRVMEELKKTGADRMTIGGYTVSTTGDVQPKIEDRTKFFEWVEEQGMDDLFTIQHGRVKQLAKEALDPEVAESLTPAARAALEPGYPGSGQLPPGVTARYEPRLSKTRTKR